MKLSVNVENLIIASEQSDAEDESAINDSVSPELIDERIRANLEPLNEQISSLTLSLNHMIYNNSARTTAAASYRAHRPQAGLSLHWESGASRTWPDIKLPEIAQKSAIKHLHST